MAGRHKTVTDRIERIREMENRMDRVAATLNSGFPLSDSTKEDLEKLDAYYRNEWMEDYQADERGELPEHLKRGVLSEDALYDLLTDARISGE